MRDRMPHMPQRSTAGGSHAVPIAGGTLADDAGGTSPAPEIANAAEGGSKHTATSLVFVAQLVL